MLCLQGLLKPRLGALRFTRPDSGYFICFLQTALPRSALNSYYLSAVIIHFITKKVAWNHKKCHPFTYPFTYLSLQILKLGADPTKAQFSRNLRNACLPLRHWLQIYRLLRSNLIASITICVCSNGRLPRHVWCNSALFRKMLKSLFGGNTEICDFNIRDWLLLKTEWNQLLINFCRQSNARTPASVCCCIF